MDGKGEHLYLVRDKFDWTRAAHQGEEPLWRIKLKHNHC